MDSVQKPFLSLLPHAKDGAAMLCVVIDLGDLRRTDRVARTLGPSYADGLTIAAQARITAAVGHDQHLAKVDADCFAFLLPDQAKRDWQPLLERLIDDLRQPLEHNGLPGALSPGIGLVRFIVGQDNPEHVLHTAITAAQDARDNDVAWRLHQGELLPETGRLRTLLADFPRALAAPDQLTLAYQPRISLASGLCLGAEALLRWNHPSQGPISPGEFIPIAEQTGLARFVTTWVVQRALSDLDAWNKAEFFQNVSINVSAVNLSEPDFAARLGASIQAHGVDPSRIELEFTEGALVRNTIRVQEAVADLAALGVHIAIDDFGTGYSNLQYLRDIPADTLKIDQSFIRNLNTNPRDQIIVRSIIRMAHELGYRLVGEGIEDSDALNSLAGWGCDEGQGYHICRPVPLSGLLAWVGEHRAGALARAG